MLSVKELVAQFAPEETGARKAVLPTPSKFEEYAKKERERERKHERRRLRGRHSHDGRREHRTHRRPTKSAEQATEMPVDTKLPVSGTFEKEIVTKSSVKRVAEKPSKKHTSQTSQQSASSKFAEELAAKSAAKKIRRSNDHDQTVKYAPKRSSRKNTSGVSSSSISSSKKDKPVIAAAQNDGRRKSSPSTSVSLPPKQAMLLAMLMSPTPPPQAQAQTQARAVSEQQPTRRKSPVLLIPPPLTASATSTVTKTHLRARAASDEPATTPTTTTKPRKTFLTPPTTSVTTDNQQQQQHTIKEAPQYSPTPLGTRVIKPRKTSATVCNVLGSIGACLHRRKRGVTPRTETRRSIVKPSSSSDAGLGSKPKPIATVCPLFLNLPADSIVSVASSDGEGSCNSSDEEIVELPAKKTTFRLALRTKVQEPEPVQEPTPEPVSMQPLGLTNPSSHESFRMSLTTSKRASSRRPTTRPLSVPRRSGMSGIVSSRMSVSTFGLYDTNTIIDTDFPQRETIDSTTDWAVRLSRGISSNFGGRLESLLARHHNQCVSVASPASMPWHEDVAVQPVAPGHGSLASLATDPWLLDDVEQYELFCNNKGAEKSLVDRSSRLSQRRISKRHSGARRVVSTPRQGLVGFAGAVEAMERREAALQADIAAFLMAKDPTEFGSVSHAQALVSRCAIGKVVDSLKHTFDDTPVWWDAELVSQLVNVV